MSAYLHPDANPFLNNKPNPITNIIEPSLLYTRNLTATLISCGASDDGDDIDVDAVKQSCLCAVPEEYLDESDER
jgi:hypothetical protein